MKEVRADLKLLITGEGYLRAQIEDQIRKNNMTERIEVRSPVWGEPFEQLLKGARFIVVPSEWYDNGVLVPYYAFGHGKPVVASRIHGLIEEVDHESNGLLFETGNAASLAQAINRLCHDNKLWMKLSRNARQKALTQLSAQKHYQRLSEIINGVIEEKHMSPAKEDTLMGPRARPHTNRAVMHQPETPQ
jgi:glycosyltransferase involved in cell wall biosynthesis